MTVTRVWTRARAHVNKARGTHPLLTQQPTMQQQQQQEQVDVAIVGAGLCGLATAVALLRTHPDASIKVRCCCCSVLGCSVLGAAVLFAPLMQRSSPPASCSSHTQQPTFQHKQHHQVFERRARPSAAAAAGAGGGVRLEASGLRAAAALSARLASDLIASGVYARNALLHDTSSGAVMRRRGLQQQQHASSPSPSPAAAAAPRQAALVVGWTELEAALLARLPPDTVVSACASARLAAVVPPRTWA